MCLLLELAEERLEEQHGYSPYHTPEEDWEAECFAGGMAASVAQSGKEIFLEWQCRKMEAWWHMEMKLLFCGDIER